MYPDPKDSGGSANSSTTVLCHLSWWLHAKSLAMGTQGVKRTLLSLDPATAEEISSYIRLDSDGVESLHEPTSRAG